MRFLAPLTVVFAFIPLSSGPVPVPALGCHLSAAVGSGCADWTLGDEQFAKRYCPREYDAYWSDIESLQLAQDRYHRRVLRTIESTEHLYREAAAGRLHPDDIPKIGESLWRMPYQYERELAGLLYACEQDRLALEMAVHERREAMLVPLLLGRR